MGSLAGLHQHRGVSDVQLLGPTDPTDPAFHGIDRHGNVGHGNVGHGLRPGGVTEAIARIAEAEREGWLGEVEGLRVSLAGAEDKLAQVTRRAASALVAGPTHPKWSG
ncbi:hypothetical protein [Kitasatospora azatica]|uniref:hypothetical protein n=1 Tax=Kitasatospora azatica TaxID=58347 RepID=UPI000AEF7CC5|nr:hypothetical protein [Kitasatospora azatica]